MLTYAVPQTPSASIEVLVAFKKLCSHIWSGEHREAIRAESLLIALKVMFLACDISSTDYCVLYRHACARIAGAVNTAKLFALREPVHMAAR